MPAANYFGPAGVVGILDKVIPGMKTSAQEDRRLLTRCLDGDKEASELFVRRFSGLIYYSVRQTLVAKSIPFSNEDLEDLHNTIFLNLFENKGRKLGQYQGKNGCSLASWLRVVAVRTVLNRLRCKGFDGAVQLGKRIPIEELPENERGDLSPLGLMERAEQRRIIHKAIQFLAPRDRLFIRLFLRKAFPLKKLQGPSEYPFKMLTRLSTGQFKN